MHVHSIPFGLKNTAETTKNLAIPLIGGNP
jgi:hypothetical protein